MTTIIDASKVQYSDNSTNSTTSSVMVKLKEITMTTSYTGSWRISFDIRTSSGGTPVYGIIYLNGSVYGTLRSTTGRIVYTEHFSSINITQGDLIQFYGRRGGSSNSVSLTAYRINFITQDAVKKSSMLVM